MMAEISGEMKKKCSRHSKAFMNRRRKVFLPLTLTNMMKYYLSQKSVGTIIASAYAEKHSIRCRQILYTPLKYTYNFAHREAIAFIGTSDPWSIVPEVQALSQKQQVPMYTYENANHSLETTDTLENLKILQDVMGKTKGFLERK